MAERKSIPGLAERLKASRINAGQSQYEAADKSGVHRVQLIKYEKGANTPSLEVLFRLAKAYGVSVCSLIPEGESVAEDEPKPGDAGK